VRGPEAANTVRRAKIPFVGQKGAPDEKVSFGAVFFTSLYQQRKRSKSYESNPNLKNLHKSNVF
jgi:hypothetical protein